MLRPLRTPAFAAVLLVISGPPAPGARRRHDDYIRRDGARPDPRDWHSPSRAGRKLLQGHGYGVANLEHEVPVKPDTVFEAGRQYQASSRRAPFRLLSEEGKVQPTTRGMAP